MEKNKSDDDLAMKALECTLVLDPDGKSPLEFEPARFHRGEWGPPAVRSGDAEEEAIGTRFSIDAVKKMMTGGGELKFGFRVFRHLRGRKEISAATCKQLFSRVLRYAFRIQISPNLCEKNGRALNFGDLPDVGP